jgi:hypothetical protein
MLSKRCFLRDNVLNISVRDRTPSKETGFLAGLKALVQFFSEKTRFLTTIAIANWLFSNGLIRDV